MKELIDVRVKYKNGRTVCICMKNRQECPKSKGDCVPDVVERDLYRGWEDCFKVDKYGRSKGGY